VGTVYHGTGKHALIGKVRTCGTASVVLACGRDGLHAQPARGGALCRKKGKLAAERSCYPRRRALVSRGR
jgi:hypothetical protein